MKNIKIYNYTLSGGCLSVTKEICTTESNLRQIMQDYGVDYGRKENEVGKVMAIARRNENGKIVYSVLE